MYELIFDLIIAVIVAGVPLWFVARRGKSVGVMQVVAAGIWLVVAYGSFIEPRILVVKEYSVDLRRDPAATARTMNLAVISDFHLGKYRHEEWLDRVVRAVNAQRPDAVLIAGDLTTSDAGGSAFAPLGRMVSPYGTYAVLGNWDYRVGAVGARQAVESHRTEVLTDESVLLGPSEAPLRLIGLDDLKFGGPDWNAAFSEVQPGETTVVLAHEPDAAPEAEVRGASLVVAGHTHGGQIRLPFIGAVPHLPISIGQGFDRGLFSFGPTRLFITPGIGESGARARLLQPPEVSILHLTY